MKSIIPSFEDIFSTYNLFLAWESFKKGKNHKKDVADFSMNLFSNLYLLHTEIISGKYKHNGYTHFKVNDPKQRDIHKAGVRDRIVHHALYNALYPYFDKKFIFDSYSCRLDKGTHRAIKRFEYFLRKESRGYIKTVWIMKCDIRKCFASVDHGVLIYFLQKHIHCPKLFAVLCSVVESFSTNNINDSKKGIPLGNLTSQLYINIYLHELDFYIKHKLNIKRYIRYADDFVIVSNNKLELQNLLQLIAVKLKSDLKLDLHPQKVHIRSLFSGVDFLGWVHFPRYRVLRTVTKKRMFRTLSDNLSSASKESYLGLLSHGNAYKISSIINSY